MLVERQIHGSRMLLDTDDPGLSAELIRDGTREAEAPFILEEIIESGMVALDVGANLGFYALIEARAGARVTAVEPNPRNVEILKKNVALNGYEITVVEAACGNKNGRARFMRHEKSNRGYMIDMVAHRPGGTEEIMVKEIPLDHIVERENLERIDLLRFDVDGYEVEMLEGAGGTLSMMGPGSWIFCELHPSCFDDPVTELMPTLENLMSHGFACERSVGPCRVLSEAVNFPRAVCEDFARSAPLVFLRQCA